MAAVLVPAMFATGFRFRPNFDLKHPAVRTLLSLSFWTIGFVVANQIALLIVRNLAAPGSSDASAFDCVTEQADANSCADMGAWCRRSTSQRCMVGKSRSAAITSASQSLRMRGFRDTSASHVCG